MCERPSYFDYVVAADIGSLQDHTAIATFEQQLWLSAETQRQKQIDLVGEDHWGSPVDYWAPLARELRYIAEQDGRPPQNPMLLTDLIRLPLGTRSPEIIDRLAALYDQYEVQDRDIVMVLDAGGPGRPVVDALWERRYPVIAVTLTGGSSPNFFKSFSEWSVPKTLLVQSGMAALQQRHVQLPARLPTLDLLINELMNFRSKLTASMHEVYEGRGGVHDDLVIAFCLGLWTRNYLMRPCDAAHWEERAETIQAARAGRNDEW
jgi:hypothetical protein